MLFHNKIRARFTDCDENEGVLSTIAQENLTGVRVVRAFGREKFERDRFEAQNKQVYRRCWMQPDPDALGFLGGGRFYDAASRSMLVVVLGTVCCACTAI